MTHEAPRRCHISPNVESGLGPQDNDTLQPEIWRKKLAALFHERDIGLLTSISGFALAVLEMGTFPIQDSAA